MKSLTSNSIEIITLPFTKANKGIESMIANKKCSLLENKAIPINRFSFSESSSLSISMKSCFHFMIYHKPNSEKLLPLYSQGS